MMKHRVIIWLAIVLGLALQFVYGAKGQQTLTGFNVHEWLGISGSIILLVACVFYAQDKGYSRNYGLLALFSIFGVIALALLPTKTERV